MSGNREMFSCPSCQKAFTYWVDDANARPKVKCYFCGKESFPKGEPEPAPAPAPAAAPSPAKAT